MRTRVIRSGDIGSQAGRRPRHPHACHNCRLKKLSCRGSRPCLRCQQDGRECTDADISDRTPLTRKRMTELENQLINYDRLWDSLFPQFPSHVVRARIEAIGVDETINEIKTSQEHSTSPHQVDSTRNPLPNRPVAQVDCPALSRPVTSAVTPSSNVPDPAAYPPTRPASPHTLSLDIAYDIHSASQTASSEWNEDKAPWNEPLPSSTPGQRGEDASPKNDYGTGVQKGVGYSGLSSGATLLRTLQRFMSGNNAPATSQQNLGVNISSAPSHSAIHNKRGQRLVLPPFSEIGPLVDAYFRYFHTLTPIVHEPTIRAQLTGALPLPTSSGSHVLFNMIFAMGALYSATQDVPEDPGLHYYEAARAALQHDLLKGGSLLLVQGLAIMSLYLQQTTKPNAGYVCLGLAIRMAMALGVHVSSANKNGQDLTVLESEMRCRIWWGLVTLETGMSMTYGRPQFINITSLFQVRLPINTEDEYLTVSSTQWPSDAVMATRYSALVTQARLSQMALYSLDRISRSQPSPSVEQIKWCGDHFRDQLVSLPAYAQDPAPPSYRLAQAVQIWRARDYASILYRPVLLSAAWNSARKPSSDSAVHEIIDACRSLSLENLSDICDFVLTNPDPHRGCEWYTLYFGIQASLTILLSIVWEPHHPSAMSWREHIVKTIGWLRQLQSMNSLGMSWVQLMEDVLSTPPNTQPDCPAENPIPEMQFEQHLSPDTSTLDFERYLSVQPDIPFWEKTQLMAWSSSEIWGDQTQVTGVVNGVVNGNMVNSEMRYGVENGVWEDMIMRLSTGF